MGFFYCNANIVELTNCRIAELINWLLPYLE